MWMKSGKQWKRATSLCRTGRAEFLFTGVNKIKPDLIEEATVNARKAAEKFAADSNSKVGVIRRSTQGSFEITDRDSSSPHRKIVSVVTTVDSFLKWTRIKTISLT